MVDEWSGEVEDALEDENNDGEDIFNMWKQMENRVYEDSTSFLNYKLYHSFFYVTLKTNILIKLSIIFFALSQISQR